ncbi:MAG: phosphoribosylaminoimidazolesuccinocarboxamide synthase, partial [Bryobacteraceae bacterium]|nr:phosphoribosylaminoimidazolesuccinocarboxamide synthase [Bryobacteraceae bacterium]
MPLLQSELPGVVLRARGKVRDVYDVGEQTLIVATDRISAFDYILPVGIPRKGQVLTQMSLFWFQRFRHAIPNHVVSADAEQYPEELQPYREQLQGRSMLVRRADMIGVECVARGYISGSGWKEYEDRGTVCGI